MGKNKRGVRDGSGPYKESYQKMEVGVGKRKKLGEVCPQIKTTKKKTKGRK